MWYSSANGHARSEPAAAVSRSGGGGGKKLKRFLILLDNDSLLYLPGSFLAGSVLVELENDTPVTGLHFTVGGEGVVRLSERSGSGYNDRESYIDFRMRMLGEGPPNAPLAAGGRVMVLSPGVHTFPFRLGLPLGLPSTFLAKQGWVQYWCKAELREASGLVHKNQQVFIIMNPIDLNLEPALLMQPFHCEIEERVGIPCLTAGTVLCRIRLDRGGYVPGESICIFATIDNSSRVTIKRTKATLTETIQYTAKNKLVHTESRELASLQKGRIASGGGDQWQNALLHIPPLPPTNLRGSHLIRIQYDVYFIIEPRGVDRPIKLQLPIMIATYPARNKDGTLKRDRSRLPAYPAHLPVFRS